MEPRSIPWGSKQKRRYQSASQSHDRRFQDIESRVPVQGSFERRHVGQKKKLEKETTTDPRKTGSQERKGRERQKLWLLWKNRSTPSRTKLPSIWTTVFEVSCCRTGAQNQERSKGTKRGRESRKQQRPRKQATAQMIITFTFRRQHNTCTEWRK